MFTADKNGQRLKNICESREKQALISTFSEEAFRLRAVRILGGRRPHTWGNLLGLSSGAVQRLIRHGFVPGWKGLWKLVRVENVSLTWLIDGIGPPYLVHSSVTDLHASRLVRKLLEEFDDWRITLLPGRVLSAIVLDADRLLDTGENKPLAYRHVVIIGGATGPLALTAAIEARERYRVNLAELEDSALLLISAGEVGPFALFGDDAKLWRGLPG